MTTSATQRPYQATVILDTRGYDEPVSHLEQKLRDILTRLGGKVETLTNLGRHDFVRVTDRNHKGDTYLRIAFSGPAGLPAAFHDKVRLDKTIKRVVIENA
jgi:ribosomal protein S6